MLHLSRAARAIELQARAQVVLEHGERGLVEAVKRDEVSLADARTLRRIAEGCAVYELIEGTAYVCEPPVSWKDWRFEVVRRCASGCGVPVVKLRDAARTRVEDLASRRTATLDMLEVHMATLPRPVTLRTSAPPSAPLTRQDRARASMHGALADGGWAARLSAGACVLDDDDGWADEWNRTAAPGVGGS